MKLLVKKLNENAITPTKAHKSDAGYDLYSPIDVVLEPGKPTKIPTGVALKLSDNIFSGIMCPNTVGLICDRSSMGSKGIKVMGGVCDSSYRGDVTVCLTNLTNQPYEIKSGDKIAQILFLPVLNPRIQEIDNLEETERGSKGFGSSGR
jgi:dUTP pyrophosphatase